MKKILCIAIFFALAVSFCAFALASGHVPDEVMEAKQSVVRVLAEYSDGYATGSGFVVKSDSESTIVATNYHVVEGNPLSISVWLSENETVSASILAYTDQRDLCLLKLAYPVQIKAVKLAENDAKQGDAVYAVGFPGAADILSDKDAHTSAEATITDGIVSAVREVTISQHGSPVTILQINAAINHGNSGGPLFNAQGEVVGIATYGIGDSQGIFGAIAVSELQTLLADNGITESNATKSNHWIWFVLPGVLILSAVTGAIIMRKKRKNLPSSKEVPTSLREYMASHPNGIGPEDSVALLLPVAIQLRNNHNEGRPHLQVSCDSVLVSSAGAFLKEPTESEADRYMSGYAAPEIYINSNKGCLSDIYSFCAVLSFASSGIQPKNALTRKEEALVDEEQKLEEKDDFTKILEKGTALKPEERFASMQDLILALSPFNTKPAAKPAEKTIPAKEPSEEKKKHRISRSVAVLIAAAAILLLLVGGYFGSYAAARSAAMRHDYSQAEKWLIVPQITNLHDDSLVRYVEAGKLLEAREFDEAKTIYSSLPGYLDSDEFVLECDYRHAAQYADANDFDNAIALYTSLEGEGYKDAGAKIQETQFRKAVYLLDKEGNYQAAYALLDQLDKEGYSGADEMKNEAQYRWAWALIEEEDYIGAYKKLDSIRGYSDVNEALYALTEVMYYKGVELYRQGEYEEARKYFSYTTSFQDTSSYQALIEVHLNTAIYWYEEFDLMGFSTSSDETLCQSLIPLIGFEDASEMLMRYHGIAEVFLRGTWSGEGYYFTMEEDGHVSYNLPSIRYGDYYCINNGEYLLYPEDDKDNTKPQFSITVVSSNCIEVYCYQDHSTHVLYKQ